MIRIVKMSFQEEKIQEFINVFDANKNAIRSFEGCNRLELLRDIDNPHIFFTYSFWDDPKYLEKYRHSDLFKRVWDQTKVLFNDKPNAWSVEQEFILS